MENDIVTFKQTLDPERSFSMQATCYLQDVLANCKTPTLYSMILRRANDGWKITYHRASIEAYNTVTLLAIIEELDYFQRVGTADSCFIQPSLEIMLQVFNPYICSLARQYSQKWREIEYDDAYAIAENSMCILYSKGYYINKNILKRTVENDIIYSLRHRKRATYDVSMDDLVNNEEDIRISDMLQDKQVDIERESKEELEEMLQVLDKVRAIVISHYSKRQYEQLLKAYGTKNTDEWSRKTMYNLKRLFAQHGWTYSFFKNKL